MVVGIDAGGVAVGERDLDGVVPYLGGGVSARFGLEHRQGQRRCESGRSFGERIFFVTLVVAGGAGTIFAEIDEIKMGGVAVGPCDVHARVGGHMYFYARGFATGMEWDGHWEKQSSAFSRQSNPNLMITQRRRGHRESS